MRAHLGTLLAPVVLVAGLALAGCGGDSGDSADDPAPTSGTPSDSPSGSTSDGEVDYTTIAIVSETAVGGESATEPVVLDTQQAVDEFAGQFSNDRMSQAIEQALASADVPEGQTPVGAVVSVGCDTPDEVSVEPTPAGIEITAGKVASPTKECFAPVTTVALVAVDADAV